MKGLLVREKKNDSAMSIFEISVELDFMERRVKENYGSTLNEARAEKEKYGKNSSQIRMSLAMDLLMLKVIRQLKMLTESHRSMEEIYGIMGGLERVSAAFAGLKNPAGEGARSLLKGLSKVMDNQDASGEKLAADVNRLQDGAQKLGLNKYVISEDMLLNNEEIDQLINGADVDDVIYRSTMDTVVNSADSFCDSILRSVSKDEEFSLFDTVEEEGAGSPAHQQEAGAGKTEPQKETAAEEENSAPAETKNKSREELLAALEM